MARKALLIGTEHYGTAFARLEATPRNVHALAEVLQAPLIGGFESAERLIDPDHSKMARTIETWLSEQDRDDFILLYISGHGVKDMSRQLYFAASTTEKNKQGELVTSTAIWAGNIRNWLQTCKAKRQIVILDCCFSGAFGNYIAQDDGAVDVEEVLGAEGRVVLTSSSSMELSFQQKEGKLSVYTHHLIEGITSGAADRDDDGEISTDDVHRYTSRKVQEESPSMTPQIIVTKDTGYLLKIANAPLGDSKVQYRKEVEKIVEEDEGEICELFSRPYLNELQQKLNLSVDSAIEIEALALEPTRQHKLKLKRYRDVVETAIKQGRYPFGDREIKRLEQLRNTLGLSKEDTQKNLSDTEQKPNNKIISQEDDHKTVDYSKLQQLLKDKQWCKADGETHNLMNNIIGTASLVRKLKTYPQDTIVEIDRLWADASDEKFGFFAQARIWQQVNRDKSEFEIRVGWRLPNAAKAINQSKLKLNLEEAEVGHFPAFFKSWGGGGWSFTAYLLDRVSEFWHSGYFIPLESEKGIDYRKLKDLLKAGRWEESDQETIQLMLAIANRGSKDWLDPDSLEKFPSQDLKTIDQLWVAFSEGRFGFSIQKKIWEESGAPTSNCANEWKVFGSSVGWRVDGEWLKYSDLRKDPSHSPLGELPTWRRKSDVYIDYVCLDFFVYLFARKDL